VVPIAIHNDGASEIQPTVVEDLASSMADAVAVVRCDSEAANHVQRNPYHGRGIQARVLLAEPVHSPKP
jgi:hypothetical protein